MPYEIGDTEPPHIDIHNELNAQVAELSTRSGIEVVLPPIVSLGDTGHVNDHNLYTVAIQKIADGLSPGPAVVASHTGGIVESGVTISGKTYDIYTFTEAMTPATLRLTDEASEQINKKEIKAAIAAGATVDELIEQYGESMRDALEVIPASDPGLSMTFSQPGFVDIIAVGGGGGTFPNSGGAGAGALLEVSQAYAPEICSITVGAGASGSVSGGGGNGYASNFAQYYAPGGGGPFDRLPIQSQGGSGAGGSYTGMPGTSGIPGLGNDGGAGANSGACGGGGGASAPGQDAPSNSQGGNGGDGKDISAFLGQPADTTVVAGGGGGGNSQGAMGNGGKGGGGNGNRPGEDNTGGGAGGASGGSGAMPGGSGLVIVRVQVG